MAMSSTYLESATRSGPTRSPKIYTKRPCHEVPILRNSQQQPSFDGRCAGSRPPGTTTSICSGGTEFQSLLDFTTQTLTILMLMYTVNQLGIYNSGLVQHILPCPPLQRTAYDPTRSKPGTRVVAAPALTLGAAHLVVTVLAWV